MQYLPGFYKICFLLPTLAVNNFAFVFSVIYWLHLIFSFLMLTDFLTLMSSQSTFFFFSDLLKYKPNLHFFTTFGTSPKYQDVSKVDSELNKLTVTVIFIVLTKKNKGKGLMEW